MANRTVRTAGYLLLAALAIALVGCAPLEDKLTIQERIANFVDDLNNDSSRTNIWKNLHPDIQNAWKDGTLWESTTFVWANRPFGLTGMTYGNPASGTLTYSTALTDPIEFTMKEDGKDDWYILLIKVNGAAAIY